MKEHTTAHLLEWTKSINVQNTDHIKCWRGRGAAGTVVEGWGTCHTVQPLWKTVWWFLAKTKPTFTIKYSPCTSYYLHKWAENVGPHGHWQLLNPRSNQDVSEQINCGPFQTTEHHSVLKRNELAGHEDMEEPYKSSRQVKEANVNRLYTVWFNNIVEKATLQRQ